MNLNDYIILSGVANNGPCNKLPVITRAPLPSPPGITDSWNGQHIWANGPYLTELTVNRYDKNLYRGNFCGLRGFPEVPGGRTTCFMSMHLDRLSIDWQRSYLNTYASYGYTDVQQSIYHSRHENNQSIGQFINTLKLIQSYCLKTDVWFTAEIHNAPIEYWIQELEYWIKSLLDAGVMDRACVGWQLDGGNTPRTLQQQIEYFSSLVKPYGIPLACHWINGACAWWDSPETAPENTIASLGGDYHQGITDRFKWHDLNRQFIDYHFLQVDCKSPINGPDGGYQGAIRDVLLTTPTVFFEYNAQDSFDGIQLEEYGDMMGYYGMCAPKTTYPLIGYGNGARMFDGTVL